MQTAREACLRDATKAASGQTKLAEAAANRERRTKRGLTQQTANRLATWEKKEQVLKSVNLTPPVDLSFLLQPNSRPDVPPHKARREAEGSHQSACDIDIRPCPEQTLSCNEHRCKGKVLAGHNNAAATCTTDRLLACPCVADGNTADTNVANHNLVKLMAVMARLLILMGSWKRNVRTTLLGVTALHTRVCRASAALSRNPCVESISAVGRCRQNQGWGFVTTTFGIVNVLPIEKH